MPTRRCVLVAASRAIETMARQHFGDRVLSLDRPSDAETLPHDVGVLVIEQDHPDRFRGWPYRLRRRWPLAEVLWIAGPWCASAAHTREGVPPVWRATPTQVCRRLEQLAAGDAPRAWPLTYTATEAVLAHAEITGDDCVLAVDPHRSAPLPGRG